MTCTDICKIGSHVSSVKNFVFIGCGNVMEISCKVMVEKSWKSFQIVSVKMSMSPDITPGFTTKLDCRKRCVVAATVWM